MIESIEIQNLSEFVSYIEKNCLEEHILFRGQSKDWKLRPKIARINLYSKNIRKVENEMIDEFKRQSVPYLTYKPIDDWDWLAIAQHHGMATRLLDWTKNAIAALWFTVKNPGFKNENGVVWVFRAPKRDILKLTSEKYMCGPFEGKRTSIFKPRHLTKSIVAQSGWFTVHKLMENNTFISLGNNKNYKKRLTKLIIKSNDFCDIRYHLDRLGINEASMFPEINGLCKYIEWLHCTSEDEG